MTGDTEELVYATYIHAEVKSRKSRRKMSCFLYCCLWRIGIGILSAQILNDSFIL